MKLSSTVQQSTAYTPVLTIVVDTLEELKGHDDALRTLLLQSSVLREFDAALLSRLAGRPEEGPQLLDEVTLYLPAEETGEKTFRYDEFTRHALLDAAARENEQILVQAAQVAASYYHDQAEKTRDVAQRRKQRLQALYYQLLANPQEGYAAWLEEWAGVSWEHADLNRQSELIALAFEVWERLTGVPEAQANILLRKGWLAYNTGDWQGAANSFWKLLGKDASAVETRLYLQTSAASPLLDGRRNLLLEGKANLGLGYAYLNQGALGWAAGHLQKATRLLGKQLAGDTEAAKTQARVLCGLGEVCAQMGLAGDALLLHRFLPEQERRLTPLQSSEAWRTLSPEDMALYRLQREAERYFGQALEVISRVDSAAGDRLRIQGLQARLYLDQGDWASARAAFEQVRREELSRLEVADERTALRTQEALLSTRPRNTERLARIQLSLGDWCLLAAEPPPGTEPTLSSKPWPQPPWRVREAFQEQAIEQMRSDLLERVAERRKAEFGPASEGAGATGTKADAVGYYDTAWALFKQINMRDGMALALRRKADVAALQPEDPAQREQALRLYEISLGMFEQLGDPDEIAYAQERLQLLADRTKSLPAVDEAGLTQSAEGQPAQKARFARQSASPEAFQQAVEKVLAHRRRFFRYRMARKLDRRLRYIYLGATALSGLLFATVLCGWLVWLTAPWLSRLSDRVSGAPWLLPFLAASLMVVVMINMEDTLPGVGRLTLNLIPLGWFWLNQDQVAIDDIGLHLYDHTGQRKQLIRWPDVVEVRAQVWEETVGEETEAGGRTAVFGKAGQVIRFDSPLRGYWRLQELVKDYLEKTGDPKRWREPQQTFIRVGHHRIFLWLFILLSLANLLAALLTLVFALIRPLTRFGPATFTVAAALVALVALMICAMRISESRYMHPSRKGLAPVDELAKL
jgi:hypothetical protein